MTDDKIKNNDNNNKSYSQRERERMRGKEGKELIGAKTQQGKILTYIKQIGFENLWKKNKTKKARVNKHKERRDKVKTKHGTLMDEKKKRLPQNLCALFLGIILSR